MRELALAVKRSDLACEHSGASDFQFFFAPRLVKKSERHLGAAIGDDDFQYFAARGVTEIDRGDFGQDRCFLAFLKLRDIRKLAAGDVAAGIVMQ